MINTDNFLEEAHKLLKENGSRITPQREYVLEVFLNNREDHLSAEDVFKLLEKDGRMQISLATVYRTVRTLYELGILREIDLAQDHKHYELADGDGHSHHHIICLNCDHHNAIEFCSDEVNELAHKIAKEHNVEVKDIELKIVGHCLDRGETCDKDKH